MTTREIKAWAIASDFGIMYDANGKSSAMAVYMHKSEIPKARLKMMIEGDRIIPITITYTT